jgi:PhoD-like phosphatase
MASLMLGPVLRHAADTEATVWVETNAPCVVSVLGCEAGTFCVGGHYYALVHVEGLEPGVITPYEVYLDAEKVWPEDDGWPHSVIRTATRDRPLTVVFGSCRTAYPHDEPYTLRKDEHAEGREVCAMRALALRLRDQPPEQWPGALVHLGDQIYADEVDPQTSDLIRGEQIADFQEYTLLYKVSWSEPAIRWLMSTVPNSMIFDDHDVIDDWNTSQEWLDEIRATDWWDERIIGAFASYWIYQHIGNLSPQDLHNDPMFDRLHDLDDGIEMLRDFACEVDRDVTVARWSFCRDIGSARLIVMDSRAARVLDPERRAMIDDAEWEYIEDWATSADVPHLLLGTSLPWLLTPGLQSLEAWNEAVCGGAWGSKRMKRMAEKLRQELDLEHWGAFQRSFERLTDLIGRVGAGADGQEPPATIVAMSGDVHHAYLAEVDYPSSKNVRSRVYQAVASPFRNPLDSKEQRVIRAMASRPVAAITRGMARAAGVAAPSIGWKLREKPIFENVIASMHIDGRDARLRIERACPDENRPDRARLECVYESAL